MKQFFDRLKLAASKFIGTRNTTPPYDKSLHELLSYVNSRSDIEGSFQEFSGEFYDVFPQALVRAALDVGYIGLKELEWDGAYIELSMTDRGREYLSAPPSSLS